MSTTLAQLEPHAAASLSMQASALDGDAALLNLQPAVMMALAAAPLITLSVILKLDLAYW